MKNKWCLHIKAFSEAIGRAVTLIAVANYTGESPLSLGKLRNIPGRNYTGSFSISSLPDSVTVYSTGGGSDIKPVPYTFALSDQRSSYRRDRILDK